MCTLHQKYNKRLEDQWDMLAIFLEGSKVYKKTMITAANSLGRTDFSDADAKIEELTQMQVSERMYVLAQILEDMVKEYASCMLTPRSSSISYSDEASTDSLLNWVSKIEGPDILREDAWRKKVSGWIKDACITAESASEEVREHMVDEFSNVEYYRILLKSWVIRNLLQHNKGIMNDRNYRVAPICEIGEKPEWNIRLYYDFHQALCLYNDHLNNIVAESPDHDIRS